MQVRTGIDILDKKRFISSIHNGKDVFLEKIFTPEELRHNTHEQLASMFCVKEAIHKALELSPGSWQDIHLTRKENGKLHPSFTNADIAKNIVSLDTSVSHEGDLIVALVCAIVNN